jgi:hypothetical protein
MIGINPWYHDPIVPLPNPNTFHYDVSTSQMPTVAQTWAQIGASIISGSWKNNAHVHQEVALSEVEVEHIRIRGEEWVQRFMQEERMRVGVL